MHIEGKAADAYFKLRDAASALTETHSMEWSPFLRQVVKTQNPLNGELSHGVVTQAIHEGV